MVTKLSIKINKATLPTDNTRRQEERRRKRKDSKDRIRRRESRGDFHGAASTLSVKQNGRTEGVAGQGEH